MKELNKEKLLERLDTMLIRACADLFEHEPSNYSEPMEEEIKQAVKQLKQLISQETQVDEEFIEKKARELLSAISFPNYDCSRMLILRTFIRSIVQEIQKLQADDELFEIKAQEYERGLKDGRLQIIRETKETHAKIEGLKSDLLANQKKYPLSYPNYRRDLDKIISQFISEIQKPKIKEKSITPIGDQAGKDDTFFKSKNMGFGYNAGISIKKPRITKEFLEKWLEKLGGGHGGHGYPTFWEALEAMFEELGFEVEK